MVELATDNFNESGQLGSNASQLFVMGWRVRSTSFELQLASYPRIRVHLLACKLVLHRISPGLLNASPLLYTCMGENAECSLAQGSQAGCWPSPLAWLPH